MTLKRQISYLILLAGLLPAAIAIAANHWLTRDAVEKTKRQEIRRLGEEIKRQITSVMDYCYKELGSLSTNPILVSEYHTDAEKVAEFQRLRQYKKFFSVLDLMDPNGFVMDSTNPHSALEQDQTSWFKDVTTKKKRVVSLPEIDLNRQLRGETALSFKVYSPIKRGDHLVGVVRASVSFDAIWSLLDNAKNGETGRFILLDDLGNMLYHPSREEVFSNVTFKSAGVDFTANPSGEWTFPNESPAVYEALQIDNATTRTRSWTLLCLVSRSEALAVMGRTHLTSLVASVASLCVLGLAGFWFARRLSRPLEQAAAAARDVASGNLQTRLKECGPREMCDLSAAFNQMAFQVLQHQEHLELLVESRTRRLQESQDSLANLTAQLRAAYESTHEAILVQRLDGTVITANKRLEEFFGLNVDDIHGKPPHSFSSMLFARFADSVKFESRWESAQASSENIVEEQWELVAPQRRILSIYSAPVRNDQGGTVARLWMFRDITEQHRLEAHIRQAHKMEAVGQLAGGVAHDFNNLLMGILGNLTLVKLEVGQSLSQEMQDCLNAATHAGERAAELVKGLLGFSRQTHLRLGRCDANALLREVQTLTRHTLDKRINVTTQLQEGVWGLNADSNEIVQVLVNMVVNARDALPNGGNIELSSRNVFLTESQAATIPGAKPGEYVRISVTDDGHGMTEEVRAKIFEPFFTTKEQGKGTGLGLATSFGIIQQHGGWITCDSMPGRGTTFHIFLPRQEVAETAKAAPAQVPSRGGRETILLVDDEVVVRSVAEAILKKNGYKVVTASDGEEALDTLGRLDGDIDLVLMDMTMPRLTGKDTFRAMRKGLARNIPVVICSGYLVDLDEFARDAGSLPDGFMQKPYDVHAMAQTVRQVLDTAAANKLILPA